MMARWRTILGTLVAAGILGAIGGISVVMFGLYNTSAQQGHWPVTEWVLHTTFENSVALHAPPREDVPDLSDPSLVELGARHYDSACAMCHASPGSIASATIAFMEPHPPQIQNAVESWAPAEMHWIVEEGVKMSGMPGWPALHRSDEVWAVVAFLTAVQDGMDAEGYAALTGGEGYCSGCHNGMNSHVPRLDILSPAYIEDSLIAYNDDMRASGIMAHAASQVEPEAYARIAQRMSTTEVHPIDPAGAPAIAREGRGTVPACLSCHGPQNRNPEIPSIAGQSRDYLVTQLRLWRQGIRGGSERAPLMVQAAQGLTDDEIGVLADYFSSLNSAATVPAQ